jgi:hypothetical protein
MVDDLLDGDRRRAVHTRGSEMLDETVGGPAQPDCLGPPLGLEVLDTMAGLVSPGVSGGLACERGPLPPGRVPSLAGSELGDLGGQGGVDLAGPRGEQLDQHRRHAGNLGLAIDDRLPPHPVAWVCSWGSSAREVDWRHVAIDRPAVSGCWRAPLTRTRVVAPNRST